MILLCIFLVAVAIPPFINQSIEKNRKNLDCYLIFSASVSGLGAANIVSSTAKILEDVPCHYIIQRG